MTNKEAVEFLKNMIDRESVGFVAPQGEGDVAIWQYHVEALNMAISALQQPTIEPRKGKWERVYPSRSKSYLRFCSVCREQCWYCGTGDYNYCPNCGSAMQGDSDG